MSPILGRAGARDGPDNEVVPDDGFDAAVERWLDKIRALGARYLEMTKVSSNVWWNHTKNDMQSSLESLIQAIGSDDMVEGARAFLEKRKPRFRSGPDAGP